MHFRKGFREKFSAAIYSFFTNEVCETTAMSLNRNCQVICFPGNNLTWTTLKKIFPRKGRKVEIWIFDSPRVGLKLLLKLINPEKYIFKSEYIFTNPYITPEFVEKHLIKFASQERTEVFHLAKNKHFYFEDLRRFAPHIDPVKYVAKMRNVTSELINTYFNGSKEFIREIYNNQNIDVDFILNHPNLGWSYKLAYRSKLQIKDILNHPNLDWDWIFLTQKIPYSEIKKYPDLGWERDYLVYNPTVSEEEKLRLIREYNISYRLSPEPNNPLLFGDEVIEYHDIDSYDIISCDYPLERKIRRRIFYFEHKIKMIIQIDF